MLLSGTVHAGDLVFATSFEVAEVSCIDAVDNDHNGLTDCGDPACAGMNLASFGTNDPSPAVFSGRYHTQSFTGSVQTFDYTFHSVGNVLLGAGPVHAAIAQLGDETAIFAIESTGGYLYRLTHPQTAIAASRDLRRGICSADTVDVAPVVQELGRSGAAFAEGVGHSLVFVATHHGCADTTQNQVIALDADAISSAPIWTFNVGEYEADYFTGCTLDYATDTLFCSSHLADAAFGNTVWAIDTVTGGLKWADNAGSLSAAPVINETPVRQVITASKTGTFRTYSLAGTPGWTSSAPNRSIVANIQASLPDPYSGYVLYTTDGMFGGDLGALYTFSLTEQPVDAWVTTLSNVVSSPDNAFWSPGNKVYVVLRDGTMHQINAASGADEATVHVTGTQATGQVEIQTLEPGWGERIVVSAQAGNGDGSTHMYCPGFPYGYHDF